MTATAWLLLLAVAVAGVWLVGIVAELLVGRTPLWRTALARAAAWALLADLARIRLRTAGRRLVRPSR